MSGLRKAMERFGYLAPIIIDQNNLVADGEHRLLVYKEFGHTEIPCYRVTFADDTERRLLRQTMNKLRGQHDFSMDAEEMALIYESNKLPDLSALIAQDERTLKGMMLKHKYDLPRGHEDDAQLDQIIDEQLKRTAPDTKLGDIIQLGNHRIICADCTDKRSIDRLFEDKQPDAIVTDPPYSSGGWQEAGKSGMSSIGTDREHDRLQRDGLSTRGYLALIKDAITQVNADALYIFTDWRMWCWTYDVAESAGFPVRNMIVWDKKYVGMGFPWRAQHELILYAKKVSAHMVPGHMTQGNVIQAARTGNVHHPTEKPLEVLVAIITNTMDANTFYDPFIGSGSTLIACEQTGKTCYGMELDAHYCDIIVKRWEAYTNQKAQRL